MRLFAQDFRFALRMLVKTPGFTTTAVATLALAIGINTAMFGIADAVLWRSLPFPEPSRIVWVGEVDAKNVDSRWGVSYGNFHDWQARARSFDLMAAQTTVSWTLHQGAEPSRVHGVAVTSPYFDILRQNPVLGRVITAGDEQPAAAPAIVLGERFWRQRFGADPNILGRSVRLDQFTFRVIGVIPGDLPFSNSGDFWVPLELILEPHFKTHRAVWILQSIARLRPGVTIGAAQLEMAGINRQVHAEHPETVRDLVLRINPLREEVSRDLRPALLALIGAVGVVLLIGCANLAGLLSVRGSGRGREMAIRSALGAGRRRIIRQLLTESLLLSLAGGTIGAGLGRLLARIIPLLTQDHRLATITFDWRVFAFAAAATALTAMLFGVAPAIQTSRTDAIDALRGGRRAGANARSAASRQILVIAEVALCMILLVGAGLLLRSFRHVLETDPGFRADHMVAMRVELPSTYKTIASVLQTFGRFQERLRTLPGVSEVTLADSLPVNGGDGTGDITIEGRPSAPGENGGASFRRVLPGYFRAMGIPLLRGRDFTTSDDRQHDKVVIISENFARKFWPGADPIGHRIKIGPADTSDWQRIIAVARDVRNSGLDFDVPFTTYNSIAQQPRLRMEVGLRTSADPNATLAAMRRELRAIEPALLIDNEQTMEKRIRESLAPRRFNLILFGFFALLALLLASIGLYGVVAYAAGQRTQEFGIRIALGAQSQDVLRLVLGQGLKLAATGVAIGIAAAMALSGLIASLLFGVPAKDPITMAGVAMLLVAVALLACWVPARRATKIAPVEALRSE